MYLSFIKQNDFICKKSSKYTDMKFAWHFKITDLIE